MTKKSGLYLLCSALTMFGLSQATPRDQFTVEFEPRCRDDRFTTNQALARFNGIFFGDFDTYGSLQSLGPLAVKGDFSAPNYVVNANHPVSCSRTRSYPSYGLVVGGHIDTQNTKVRGSAYVNGSGTMDQIVMGEQGCTAIDNKKTGVFNFTSVEEDLRLASLEFANREPTAILKNDATFTKIPGNEMAQYDIMTFHSCGQAVCSSNPTEESQAEGMLFGQGDWKGPKSAPNRTRTYVYNIPVKNGATITLDTSNPSAGLNACNSIYNFYPVDDNGNILPDGEFTLNRKTGGQLQGFVLAPRGNIVDGSVGAFAGNIVGKSYTWENPTEGAELLDYHAAGGSCDSYSGCMPFFLPPGTGNSFSRSTTTTRTTTQATSKSTSTTTEFDIDTTTETLTELVTETAATATATATATETATATATATVTETFLEEVQPVTTTIGAVTATETLIGGTIIEKVGTETITLLPEPVVETVIIVVDRDPETLTVSGETVVVRGENVTYTQEVEDTRTHGPDEYTTETYTTTITDPYTFVSTYTTTRLLYTVYTYIGEGTTIEQTFEYAEVGVPLFFTAELDPEPATPLTVTETHTVIEWQHRKHYHKGSGKECYKDDEDKEDDYDEGDEDNDNDNDNDDDDDDDDDEKEGHHKKKHHHHHKDDKDD